MCVCVSDPSAVTSEGSIANSSLDPSNASETEIPVTSDPLSVGGTPVTSSLTQPSVADKLMWSPSTPAALKAEQTTSGTWVCMYMHVCRARDTHYRGAWDTNMRGQGHMGPGTHNL